MSGYRLSNKAASDLIGIYRYSYQQFGITQADSYLQIIEEKLIELAESPELAPAIDDIRPGYRRAWCQKHVIYFQAEENHIFIVRILHQQMKASIHLA